MPRHRALRLRRRSIPARCIAAGDRGRRVPPPQGPRPGPLRGGLLELGAAPARSCRSARASSTSRAVLAAARASTASTAGRSSSRTARRGRRPGRRPRGVSRRDAGGAARERAPSASPPRRRWCATCRSQCSERDGERTPRDPRRCSGSSATATCAGSGEALAELGGDLPFHQPKHEQAMVHTAIGFAKAHAAAVDAGLHGVDRPGRDATSSPGAATATTNRLPVLLLPGDTFAKRRQGPVLQQLQHPGYARLGRQRVAAAGQPLLRPHRAARAAADRAAGGDARAAGPGRDRRGHDRAPPGRRRARPTTSRPRFFEPRTWAVTRRPPAGEEIAAATALLRAARAAADRRGRRRPLLGGRGGARSAGRPPRHPRRGDLGRARARREARWRSAASASTAPARPTGSRRRPTSCSAWAPG